MATLFDHEVSCVSTGVAERSPPLVVVRLATPAHVDGVRKGRPSAPVGKDDPRARYVQPKGRPGFIVHYTGARTRNYENALRTAAIDAMAGRPILDGPLAVIVFAYFPVPESWSANKREAALAGELRPTVKPDWENIGKTLDALNPYRDKQSGLLVPIVWRDDAVVVDGRVIKLYAVRTPGIVVEVRRAGPPPSPYKDDPK